MMSHAPSLKPGIMQGLRLFGGISLLLAMVSFGPWLRWPLGAAAAHGSERLPAFLSPPLGDGVRAFGSRYCVECHGDGPGEGGLNMALLDSALTDTATFAVWERIFDRVQEGSMPPVDAEQPTREEMRIFLDELGDSLRKAHRTTTGTVLRRLNRREYQNTMNDLFGTNLDLAHMLPEDSRAGEFDNVGAELGLSMVHMQGYLDAADSVLEAAIASTVEKPSPDLIEAGYSGTREAEKYVGKTWKELPDGAIVRFSGGGYPTGMIRGSQVNRTGKYRIRITGYAHQSPSPVTFSIGSTSFAAGSEKQVFGFASVPPDRPTTVELEARMDARSMLSIEPQGIAPPQSLKEKPIADYEGPGLAILRVRLEGPLLDEFPSRGHRLVFDGITRKEIDPSGSQQKHKRDVRTRFEIVSDDERHDALQALIRIAEAAFRMPVTIDDVLPYAELFQRERTGNASFEEALRTAVCAIFCSPRFLYLHESPGLLDDFALASRLSYLLTRTAPDRSLWELAAQGRLTGHPRELREQTERLLSDPRSERFITDFCDSWLDLREIDFTSPDKYLFPEFDEYLRFFLPLETRAFIRELIDSDLAVTNLVQSDFAMLNGRLAEHYGLPPLPHTEILKTRLPPDSVRGGLLSQASILKVTANGTNTSPVMRGVWVMERICGKTVPPPPPGVAGVEPDIRGAATIRELLDKHRSLDSCNSCHRVIDPPGFALESFNPIGGFRERYRSLGGGDRVETIVHGQPVRYRLGGEVDSSGQLADGRSFSDFRSFRDALATDDEMLARTLATKLLTFATGREMGFSDRDEIEDIVRMSAKNGHGVRNLLHLVIASRIFQEK
jgi:hypothetical protein